MRHESRVGDVVLHRKWVLGSQPVFQQVGGRVPSIEGVAWEKAQPP